MASRLAKIATGVPCLRSARALPALSTPIVNRRYESNIAQRDPKKTAQSILDSLPGESLVTKSAILSAGTGLSIAAISNELYVFNEESVVMLSLLTVYWAVAHYGGPMYSEWAETQINKAKNILVEARKGHAAKVQERIDKVRNLSDVIDITKNLFAVSKETAQLEAKVYELEQRTAVAREAKSVLDSWVRWEAQVKAREQKEMADAVISKVEKELENPRVLKQILDQSVSEVEKILTSKEVPKA